MFLVVLPAVLLGYLLATVLLPGSLLVAHPHLGWLLDVPPGLLAGLGLGFWLQPPSGERIAARLVLTAVMTAVVVLALLGLAQLRAPATASGTAVSAVALGVAVTVLVQVVVTAALWRTRGLR